MSVLTAKMFDVNMSKFQFVFSVEACIKTCIYFAVMYIAVMIFNTVTVSKYKLINLINANKKNESIKIKNPIISGLIFIVAAIVLGYAYWKVTGDLSSLQTADKLLMPILMGIVRNCSYILVYFWVFPRNFSEMQKDIFKGYKCLCFEAITETRLIQWLLV